MARPYVAVVEDDAVFDPVAHARWDLFPLSLSIRQSESQLAEVEMEVQRTSGDLTALENRRIIVSLSNRLMFDGVISAVPQGIVGATMTLNAVSRPVDTKEQDAQLAELADSLKTSPYWEPLCVPEGQESDWAEILAARKEVLSYSRERGIPVVMSALSTGPAKTIEPFEDSVSYSESPGVAKKYGINLSVNWKQLVLQTLDDGTVLRDIETMTPDGLLENFPKVAASVGDGFSVISSSAEVRSFAGKPIVRRTVNVIDPVESGELDPAFIEEGSRKLRADVFSFSGRLRVRYLDAIARSERTQLSVSALVQASMFQKEEHWENIVLRDITKKSPAQPWESGRDYFVDDMVVDGDRTYRARVDHTAGDSRSSADWIQVGESDYLESRRMSSFLTTDRGRVVLEHCLKRMEAKALADARCVRVSFECEMPSNPWMISLGMPFKMESDRLPGGYARGQLCEYEFRWDNGDVSFAGAIVCIPGVDGTYEPAAIAGVSGRIPIARGRMSVSVDMDADQQERVIENGGREIPETTIVINTTPVPSSGFEQTINAPISGSISFPKEVLV